MSKIAIVYWSSTGNTEAMAECLEEAVKAGGADVSKMEVSDFSADMVDNYDVIAFGCPAMGDEVLEEDEFAPMFEAVEPKLASKKIALFGSYDWGDGEWMRNWKETCEKANAVLVCDPVIANNEPDDEAKDQLKAMAEALVK